MNKMQKNQVKNLLLISNILKIPSSDYCVAHL